MTFFECAAIVIVSSVLFGAITGVVTHKSCDDAADLLYKAVLPGALFACGTTIFMILASGVEETNKVDNDSKSAVISLYEDGKSAREIADLLDLRVSSVRDILEDEEDEEDAVISLHEDGKSAREIADLLDLRVSKVRDILEDEEEKEEKEEKEDLYDKEDAVVSLHEDGKSVKEISETLDLDISEVAKILADEGLI